MFERLGAIIVHTSLSTWLLTLGGIAAFFAIAIPARLADATLRSGELYSGYALYTICLCLVLFAARKRLPVLALSRVKWWTTVHVILGLLALAVFWLHLGMVWPSGLYEQLLAALFYLVTLSGILGYFLEQVFPRRLTQTGIEVIFERIPEQLADYREQAEQVVLECTEEHHSETLARIYLETFHWFFRKPRFVLSHFLGGQHAAYWVNRQLSTARRYLNASEQTHLNRLQDLAYAKTRLDLHYAIQGFMKTWLLVHVPCVAAMLTVATWHLLIVHIYTI